MAQTSQPGYGFCPFANTFTLDNGLEQLSPFFSRIEIKRYDDGLRVTEVEPLMAYIRSTFKAAELSESVLANVRQGLENLLKTNGEIFIKKDSGLFKSIKVSFNNSGCGVL